MATQNMLDVVFDEAKVLRNVHLDLCDLANAFELTGNMQFAARLDRMAEPIYEVQENITKAVTGEINEQVNRSMEQVGKTLSALVDKQS